MSAQTAAPPGATAVAAARSTPGSERRTCAAPGLLQGSYLPGFMEPRRSSEKASAAVLQGEEDRRCFQWKHRPTNGIGGVSTRPGPARRRATLHGTNPIERLIKAVKRRAEVVGPFPDEGSITRVIGAQLFEQNDERRTRRRAMQLGAFSRIAAAADPVLGITVEAA